MVFISSVFETLACLFSEIDLVVKTTADWVWNFQGAEKITVSQPTCQGMLMLLPRRSHHSNMGYAALLISYRCAQCSALPAIGFYDRLLPIVHKHFPEPLHPLLLPPSSLDQDQLRLQDLIW